MVAFLEQNRSRSRTEELLENLQQRSLCTDLSFNSTEDPASSLSDDEDDEGLKYPTAFALNLDDFTTGLDYVKSFVKETKKMHRGDVHNEERKAKSLGNVFTTENLHPECFRAKFTSSEVFLTAMVPVLKETYKADFSERRPNYELINSELLKEEKILGILTPKYCGQIPPVTVC